MSKILSIGDQRVSLDLARKLLGRDGHDWIEAADALAGLHRAVEDAPDCILVDLDLAGFDAFALCDLLCADATTRRIPIVVWGSSKADHAAPQAKRSGASAYVDRARTPGALAGTVQRLLAEARCGVGSSVRTRPSRPSGAALR